MSRIRRLMQRWLAIASLAALGTCGGSTPTSPEPAPAVLTLGPQFMLLAQTPSTVGCGFPPGSGVTNVATTLTLSWSGSEWVATSSSAAAGDVELRFRESSTANGATAIPVAGTIKGTAMHLPEHLIGIPPYIAQINFGADNRTTITGQIVPPGTTPYPFAIVEAGGSGSTSSGGTGVVCAGASFSFTLFPQTSTP